jgi:hypothetical protein
MERLQRIGGYLTGAATGLSILATAAASSLFVG